MSKRASIKDIDKYPDLPWNFDCLFKCEYDYEIINRHIDKPWNFIKFFSENIDLKMIKKHPEKIPRLIWNEIYKNPRYYEELSCDFLIKNDKHNTFPKQINFCTYDSVSYFCKKAITNNNFKRTIKKYEMGIKAANIIGEWFLKCKYDPSYKYCRDRLNKEYDQLGLGN